MALLPGVPDMGPAPVSPVSPTIKTPGKASIGAPSGFAKVAQGTGKPGNTEHLGSVVGRTGKGISNLGGGSQIAHSMNSYGKNPAKLPGIEGLAGTGGVQPTSHSGAGMVRGGSGGMKPHIRPAGGSLGPGNMGQPGPSDTDYSMNSGDTE